jgi:hypothetical protein
MEIKQNTLNYKIKTNTGWQSFSGISYNGKKEIYELLLEKDIKLKVTDEHKIYVNKNKCISLKELKVNDSVLTIYGYLRVLDIEMCSIGDVYDILDVSNGNKFFANDILVHNCQFIGKSGTLIDSTYMRTLMDLTKNKTYKFVIDGDIRFYKELDKNMKYLVAIDPSMGVSGDFSAIQVFEFPSFIQTAEWMCDSLNQNDQVEKLKTLVEWMYSDLKAKGCRTPEIYWSLENNSVGEGFICSLREKSMNNGLEKPQDYIRRGIMINELGNKRIGFTTTKRSKTMSCAQLKNLLENNRMIINSSEYVRQLSNFTLREVNYSASGKGEHDDLITASLTILLMYLQSKNELDLHLPIMNNTYKIDASDNRYDMPFLFFSH